MSQDTLAAPIPPAGIGFSEKRLFAGVPVEVPVMLSLVAFATRTQHWFPEGSHSQ